MSVTNRSTTSRPATNSPATDKEVVTSTQCWVNTFVVAHNICPFARREVEAGSIRYQVVGGSLQDVLVNLVSECQLLDSNNNIETTLLIYPCDFANFDDYLDLLELANQLIEQQGYQGTYQLASFHPQYCFDGVAPDDPSHYTNRSPYPMLHLLREASLEKALAVFPNPEQIPERNIERMRTMGLASLQANLSRVKTGKMHE